MGFDPTSYAYLRPAKNAALKISSHREYGDAKSMEDLWNIHDNAATHVPIRPLYKQGN